MSTTAHLAAVQLAVAPLARPLCCVQSKVDSRCVDTVWHARDDERAAMRVRANKGLFSATDWRLVTGDW